MKKRILIHVPGFPPGTKYGGIATSRYNMAITLQDKYDVYVVARNHDYQSKETYTSVSNGLNRIDNINVIYIPDEDVNQKYLMTLFAQINPEIVYCSGTITSYFRYSGPAIKAAKKLGIPVITTPDGDLKSEALDIKPLKKRLAFLYCIICNVYKNISFQVTTNEEKYNLIKYLQIKDDAIFNIPFFPYRQKMRLNYHKKKGLLRIVFCSRIQTIKNLDIAIQVVKEMKNEAVFDIYGQPENQAYLNQCLTLLDDLPDNVTISYKGELEPNIARRIAEKYDCFLLPTESENYCFAIEEALTCGCPCVISRGTTPWDDLDSIAGYCIPLRNQSEFTKKLDILAEMTDEEYQVLQLGVKEYISKKVKTTDLIEQYDRMFTSVMNCEGINR